MSKKNMKKLLLSLTLSSILFVVSGSNSPVTEAKYNPVSRKICSLAVAPYNPTSPAITGLAADPYINFLSADSCNQFVKLYGNAYSPQPPKSEDNPLKAGTEDKNVPIIRHDHSYYNDTEQDANFYYKSFVDKFEITLQSDGFNSIDINKIQCQTPYPLNYDKTKISSLEDCSGTVDDLWGGTTLTKKTVGNTVVIAWDFGTTNQNGKFIGRPQIWANNGKDFDQGDFTDENNRKLEFNVHLPTKNNEKIWSTTTTSKVLLADLAINKANYAAHKNDGCVSNDVNNSNSGWCYMDPKTNEPTKNFLTENVFTTADHTFYWFDIGSVATVWKKFQPLPNVCTELKATLNDKNPIKINGKDAYQMTVDDITFAPKNIVPNEAELKWTTDDPNGKFYQDLYMATPNLPPKKVEITKNADGSINTGINTTVYYSGKPESKIKVALDAIPADQIGPLCNASMQTPAVLECTDILVDHPEHIYENTYSTFKAKALGSDGKDLTGKIKYWVDSGYGEFYTVAPTGVAQNKSKMVYEATATSQTFPFGGNIIKPDFTLDPKIFVAGNSNSQAAETFIDLAPKFAAGTFGIQDVSGNIQDPGKLGLAIQIKVLELPKWVTNPIPMDISPVDPSPMDSKSFNPAQFGKNSVFDFNIDPNKAIGPGQNIDIQNAATLGNSKQFFFSSLFESITVDPGTTVYFNAKKPGKGVIHVQVVGSTNLDCSKSYDIEPQPELICKELNFVTNTKGNLIAGKPAAINISPKDTNGNKLVPTTKFNISTTTNGQFKSSSGKDLTNTALLSDFPISLVNATTTGTVSVSMDIKDPAYSATCAGTTNVITVGGQCTELTATLYDVSGKTYVNELGKDKKYIVDAKIKTNNSDAHKITYSIDPKFGYFTDLTDLLNPKNVQEITLNEIKMSPLVLTTLAGAPTGFTPDVIKINGAGFDDITNCKTKFPFNNPAPVLACNSLSISPKSFDGVYTQGQKFTVTLNSNVTNGIQVDLITNVINNKPTISKAPNQQAAQSNTLIFTNSEIVNNQVFVYYIPNTFGQNPPTPNTATIQVKAINPEDPKCIDAAIAQVPITPPCNPDKESCGDGGGGSPTTPPLFLKYVYPENHIKDANTTININKNTNVVTYMLVLKVGDTLKEATITDKSLIGGVIRSNNATNPGRLHFSNIRIEVMNGNTKQILYASTPNRDNETGTKTGSLLDFSDKDLNTIQNGKYENNLCGSTAKDLNGKTCINVSSITDIQAIFQEGAANQGLTFKNLSSNSKIIIKYEMSYQNRIDDAKCQKMAAEGGCGQEFNNTAHFEATKKSGATICDNNAKKSGNILCDASAKVIAICPYVLSRQGGDVFFHDLIQTGVDVNKCYEVKSCDGPCIQPESDKEKNVPSTGTGAGGDAPLLQSPSHDVCSKSNISAEQEGGNVGLDAYQDVLKNFSSSICELRADVSTAWTKKNVTDSINANVKRLSRFGSNLNLTSYLPSPSNLPKDVGGVYVKFGGELRIGDGSNPYIIGSPIDGNPSAQTYIVIGGDIRIQSNIKYDNTSNFIQIFDKKSIASAAFIVIGGNIKIDNGVNQIDGVLMAVESTDGKGGEIRSTENTPTDTVILNINGNLIGNVYNLFNNRQAVGDPLKDQGSVNIHYDERILLNPPPGISELINLQQVVVPN